MKKFFVLFTITLLSVSGFAQNFPAKPATLVNDYTGTLSSTEVQQLERKLVAFDDSSSVQTSVVVIKSLDGFDIADYGYRLGRAWGIGNKEKNTGVLLLVSIGDRKVTIQTGYGVEGALPDAITKRIIENEIKPNFIKGNYFAGIDAGTDAIISYTKGEYKNNQPRKSARSKSFPAGLLIAIIVIIIIVISRGGGGRNGGKRVIGSRGGADIFWWSMLGGALGSRGGGGGFGGGGGGGFGGFGGGSFGGGGSSGSW